jgi:hypothetical protein
MVLKGRHDAGDIPWNGAEMALTRMISSKLDALLAVAIAPHEQAGIPPDQIGWRSGSLV